MPIANSLLEHFLSAYLVTAQIMFPILTIIVILLIKDFNKYGNISKKIHSKLDDLSNLVENTGYKKDSKDGSLTHIEKYLSKKKSKT